MPRVTMKEKARWRAVGDDLAARFPGVFRALLRMAEVAASTIGRSRSSENRFRL